MIILMSIFKRKPKQDLVSVDDDQDYLHQIADNKMTLAEQQNWFIEWASNAEMKPKYRSDVMKKIASMDRALDGEELDAFIQQLAELKLGVAVTDEEILRIVELSNKVDEAKESGDKAAYDKAVTELEDYRDGLIAEAETR